MNRGPGGVVLAHDCMCPESEEFLRAAVAALNTIAAHAAADGAASASSLHGNRKKSSEVTPGARAVSVDANGQRVVGACECGGVVWDSADGAWCSNSCDGGVRLVCGGGEDH